MREGGPTGGLSGRQLRAGAEDVCTGNSRLGEEETADSCVAEGVATAGSVGKKKKKTSEDR